MKRVVLAASLAASSLGCDDPQARAKLSLLQQDIFTPSCALAGCHSEVTPQAGLDLTDGTSYSSLVGVDSTQEIGKKRVVPGDPAASVLFQSVQGTSPTLPRMPFGLRPLPQADIEAIAHWILQGAKDD